MIDLEKNYSDEELRDIRCPVCNKGNSIKDEEIIIFNCNCNSTFEVINGIIEIVWIDTDPILKSGSRYMNIAFDRSVKIPYSIFYPMYLLPSFLSNLKDKESIKSWFDKVNLLK